MIVNQYFPSKKAVIALTVFCAMAFSSCDKIPREDNIVYFDDDYVKVSEWIDDWSGDYAMAHSIGTGSVALFIDQDGKASENITTLDNVLLGSDADEMKMVLAKSGDYYVMHIENAGYIGFDGKDGFTRSFTKDETDDYLWDVLYAEAGNELVKICPKTSDDAIIWNGKRFAVGAENGSLLLYRRVLGTGIKNTPTPEPEPDPDPEPDPEPNPEPEPDPQPTNAKYGWFELPAVNYEVVGSDLRGKDNNTLYYAHHFCAGGEIGPGGKTARNFTVCYNSEYRCPMWVAAPRHKMYKGSGRHDNYKNDPKISCVQNGKWTGYTRGHMIGSSDRNHSVATNHQVFYHSNIAPQIQDGFNTGGGAWNNLEDHIDGLECSDTLYAVVGCYFGRFTDKYNSTIEPRTASGGQIPTMFYYVLLRTKKGNSGKSVTQCSASELQCVAFVLSHKGNKGHRPQAKDMMSVSDLEKLTDFSYFPNVPNAPKDTYNASDWL